MIIDEANKIALGFQVGEGLQTQSGIQLPEYKISSKKYLWLKWEKFYVFEFWTKFDNSGYSAMGVRDENQNQKQSEYVSMQSKWVFSIWVFYNGYMQVNNIQRVVLI
jgi:hypothetical protein